MKHCGRFRWKYAVYAPYVLSARKCIHLKSLAENVGYALYEKNAVMRDTTSVFNNDEKT